MQIDLQKSRRNMKVMYDKRVNINGQKFNVNDEVMLWKPYKKSGLSRCFQPNWDGPWRIEEFTSATNCKIKKVGSDDELDVHLNQLKQSIPRDVKLKYQYNLAKPSNQTSQFNHYIEDFFGDVDGGMEHDASLDDTIPFDENLDENLDDTIPYDEHSDKTRQDKIFILQKVSLYRDL